MFRTFVILISIIWASLLLISWGGTSEPPVSAGSGIVQEQPSS